VAECNAPAIRLYERMGFRQMEGLYELRIDESMVLYERGYEIAL
jgi:ribosomal protein S18 acetylase RimI-like enzyme